MVNRTPSEADTPRSSPARLAACAALVLLCMPLVCAPQSSAQQAKQTTADRRYHAPGETEGTGRLSSPVPAAPAGVVSVVHRIGGWRLLTLLERRELRLPAAGADRFVHTNIVAGFALGERRYIVVRLPQAEVEALAGEMPPEVAYCAEASALTIIDADQVARPARFVGLDAVTGLSLLERSDSAPLAASAPVRALASSPRAASLSAGDEVFLFAPEAASGSPTRQQTAIRMRMGERRARLLSVPASGGERTARLLEPAGEGGRRLGGAIVTDGRGGLLGVVGDVSDDRLRIILSGEIEAAVDRVLRRGASVAQPWLGAQGQDLAAAALGKLRAHGWTLEDGRALLAEPRGVLLTNVPPHTPAALAGLRAGDIVTEIDGEPVNSESDFKRRLAAAGAGATLRFTITRAGSPPGERVRAVVRLGGSLDPSGETDRAARLALSSDPTTTLLLSLGVEAVRAPRDLCARFGVADGLFVVALRQGGAAAAAGLRPGDIIERISVKSPSATHSATLPRTASPGAVRVDLVRRGRRSQIKLDPAPAAQ